MAERRLRVWVLANWGIGRVLLAGLDADPRVSVQGVVTRNAGTSEDPWQTAVYDLAETAGLTVVPESAAMDGQLEALLRRDGADLLFVHACHHRLAPEVFEAPRFGTVNLHPSLLPRHRGPDPTAWVLAAGDGETGLTAHYMDEGLDTGPIIAQQKIPVEPGDTRESVIERLKSVVSPLVGQTLSNILDPGFRPLPQNTKLATYEVRPGEHVSCRS